MGFIQSWPGAEWTGHLHESPRQMLGRRSRADGLRHDCDGLQSPKLLANSQCVTDIAAVQERWKAYLNLRPSPYNKSESMGGFVTWNAIAHGTLSPIAVVGIYPACNLSNMYAGECRRDRTGLSGHPERLRFFESQRLCGCDCWVRSHVGSGVKVHCVSDPHVGVLFGYFRGATDNEDPFAARVNAAGGNAIINTSTGNHGDASNFDPQAVLEFFESH
jgi:hypothetical protein